MKPEAMNEATGRPPVPERAVPAEVPAIAHHGFVQRSVIEARVRASNEDAIWIEVMPPVSEEEIAALVEYLRRVPVRETQAGTGLERMVRPRDRVQLLADQWTCHIGRCNQCHGYPNLCNRGRQLHKQLHPEDWNGDVPTRHRGGLTGRGPTGESKGER